LAEYSARFEDVKRYYNKGNGPWTKNMVHDAVERWITEEEYKEITGEEYIPVEKEPSQMEEMQLIMMEAMADQYEEQQAVNLATMEAQATIYEELLAMQGLE